MRDILFEKAPPGSVQTVSDPTDFYNCVAWAVSRNDQVIWPDEDELMRWPPTLPRTETVDVLAQFFVLAGFERCPTSDLERGFEKVAIYEKDGIATHAARQCVVGQHAGQWTSKLGPQVDIRHRTAEVITGKTYGRMALVMRRPYNGRPPALPPLHPPPPLLVTPSGLPLGGQRRT
jgi:hypothetical protein